MARRAVLIAIGLSSLLLTVFCLIGGGLAGLGFATIAMAFPALLMLLGIARADGRLRAAAGPIVVLLLALEACLVGMLVFQGQVADGPWFLGLPAAASIQIYGIFLAPMALVALGFALTFADFEVADDDLERLRELAGRRRSDEAAGD